MLNDTNKSLLLATMACLSMGLFAKSPQFASGQSWVSGIFVFATLGLSVWGFRLGVRGAQRQRTVLSWLAPSLNALVFGSFVTLLMMLVRALKKLQ